MCLLVALGLLNTVEKNSQWNEIKTVILRNRTLFKQQEIRLPHPHLLYRRLIL